METLGHLPREIHHSACRALRHDHLRGRRPGHPRLRHPLRRSPNRHLLRRHRPALRSQRRPHRILLPHNNARLSFYRVSGTLLVGERAMKREYK